MVEEWWPTGDDFQALNIILDFFRARWGCGSRDDEIRILEGVLCWRKWWEVEEGQRCDEKRRMQQLQVAVARQDWYDSVGGNGA